MILVLHKNFHYCESKTNSGAGDVPLRDSVVEDVVPLPLAPLQGTENLARVRMEGGVVV